MMATWNPLRIHEYCCVRDVEILQHRGRRHAERAARQVVDDRAAISRPIIHQRSPHSRVIATHDVVERADRRNGDRDGIAGLQREVVGRHDAGAGQQHGAVREAGLPIQVLHQFFRRATHLRQRRAALEDGGAVPDDRQRDACVGRQRFLGDQHPGPSAHEPSYTFACGR
jgi:hypothetical protein